MHKKLIDKTIKYSGDQLAPHWIYKNFNLQGDAIVSFCGECEVKLTEMVDIEDVINNEPIYSKNMLHFIIEHFNIGLVEGVQRQRLLICTIKETLEELIDSNRIKRSGDDIFVDGKKLSVSIATKTLTSVLIHTGINIDPTGAPIEASGLEKDLNITDIKTFANNVMTKYANEINDIILASTKVTGR